MTDEMIEEALDAVSVWSRVENATSERQIAEHAIKAFREALAKAGLGIRPRKPTKEMIESARQPLPAEVVKDGRDETGRGPYTISLGHPAAFWRAMWDTGKPDG